MHFENHFALRLPEGSRRAVESREAGGVCKIIAESIRQVRDLPDSLIALSALRSSRRRQAGFLGLPFTVYFLVVIWLIKDDSLDRHAEGLGEMNFYRVGVSCFLAMYAIAYGLEWLRLRGRNLTLRIATLACGFLGLIAHTTYIFVRSWTTHLPPLLSSSHDWLLVLAYLAVVTYLFLSALDRDLAIGVFLLPIVLVLTGSTYFVSDTPNHRLDSLYGWKLLHASLLVVGMLGVLVGFVLAMMYLVQQWRLRHRQMAPEGFGIPSLEKLARLNRWSILIAVPLLTGGMLTGVVLGFISSRSAEPVHFNDPVIIGSSVAWLFMFALFVWLMGTRRTTGRQVASLTLWAAGFLMMTLVGLQVATGKKVFDLKTWHVQRVAPLQFLLTRTDR